MIWLAAQMWMLLLIAFGLGLALGGWIFTPRKAARRRVRRARTAGVPPPPARQAAETGARNGRPEGDGARSDGARSDGADNEKTAVGPEPVRPFLLDAPQDGSPDNLQKISGIGPSYERLLNEMGIYYYAQIANWSPGEIAWLDQHLKFPGRIRRDRWQEQARLLMLSMSFATGEPKADMKGRQHVTPELREEPAAPEGPEAAAPEAETAPGDETPDAAGKDAPARPDA